MNATIFLNALWVFLLIVGGCFLLLWFYKAVHRINIQSQTASPQPQNLTIRIIEGYFGVQRNSRSTQLILLRIKVDGPPATLKDWKLILQRDNGRWGTGYVNPIKEPIRFEEESRSTEFRRAQLLLNSLNTFDPYPTTEQLDPIPDIALPHAKSTSPPLSTLVPDQGWLFFHVPEAGDRFSELLFGSVFALTAIENNGVESICNQTAGEWLHRAIINFP